MKFLTLFGFALVFCITAPALARGWSAAQIDALERAALAAPQEGLPAPALALDRVAVMRRVRDIDPVYQGALDQAADDLFAFLAQAYARGALNPASVDAEWRLAPPPPADIAALAASLDDGASPYAVLQALLPRGADYRALRAELALLAAAPDTAEIIQKRGQIRANLERWRWLPRDWPARRVEVRLAQFELLFYSSDGAPLQHAVIVGARASPSPVFSAMIEAVTLNPDWTPPQSIAANELLPRFRRNPGAAAREGFEALDSEGRAVDPDAIDWNARPFPYRLRQRPGPGNALGQLRFDLPNPYAVYLHDTPSRSLFGRIDRALSHGCIRVQDPVGLAAAMIAPDAWDAASLQAAIETGAPRSIALPAPIPVYVLYLTNARAEDGSVIYLDDLYQRDRALIAALDAPPLALMPSASGLCAP
jgi:murein L,D-transpeptidase YcbB/YkuD